MIILTKTIILWQIIQQYVHVALSVKHIICVYKIRIEWKHKRYFNHINKIYSRKCHLGKGNV